MATIGSFSTVRFNKKDGYIIEKISPEVSTPSFQKFLDDLADHPNQRIDIGMKRDALAIDLHTILSQLRDQPINNGVKQIDVRDVKDFVNQVDKENGFREFWLIDDNGGGKVSATKADDIVLARGGADRVLAWAGDDFVSGGKGRDILKGNNGDDHLNGDQSRDRLFGGNGNDILHGGDGSDALFGGSGADTFYFDSSDFRGAPNRDVIRDYKSADQIVDITGDLKVIATGNIALFNGRGTLIENEKTGDLVFVKGAYLKQSDIKDTYVAPPPDAGDNTVVRKTDVFDPRIQSTVVYDDGITKVEVFRVFLKNLTDEQITNIEDLKIRIPEVAKLEVDAAATYSATYDGGGVFDLSAGGDRTLNPYGEIEAFSFTVKNRPGAIVIDDGDVRTVGTPRSPDGPVKAEVGFSLSLKVVNESATGASVEVFIKNIGSKTLVDLENMELRFTEKNFGKLTSTWGADFYDNKFAVEPWEGYERPPLAPDDKAKLFGFAFTYGEDGKNHVDIDDFVLASSFSDLLS